MKNLKSYTDQLTLNDVEHACVYAIHMFMSHAQYRPAIDVRLYVYKEGWTLVVYYVTRNPYSTPELAYLGNTKTSGITIVWELHNTTLWAPCCVQYHILSVALSVVCKVFVLHIPCITVAELTSGFSGKILQMLRWTYTYIYLLARIAAVKIYPIQLTLMSNVSCELLSVNNAGKDSINFTPQYNILNTVVNIMP